jgi:hypothetical protein
MPPSLTILGPRKTRVALPRLRVTARVLCSVLLAVLSNGCSSVWLGDVTDYSALPESVHRERDLRNETSRRHVLTAGDSVELTAGDKPLDFVEVDFVEGGVASPLMQNVPRAALPIPLLVAADRIKVTHGGKITELRPAAAAKPGRSWSGLASVLRVDGLKAQLVPENRTWVRPGDTVVVRRMYHEKSGSIGGIGVTDAAAAPASANAAAAPAPDAALATSSKPQRFFADEYRLTVDGNGDIWIPPISSAGLGITAHTQRSELIGAIDRATFKVRVWNPETAYAKLPSLEALANCLTAAQAAGPADAPAVCTRFGIDARFSPSTDKFQNIRYQIDGELGSWTLVDEQDHRLTVPRRRGEPLLDAVRIAYRRLAHGELIRNQIGLRKAYVTVLPDESWGVPCERQSFSVEYSTESLHPLPQTTLLRGDTVFISRERPRRPREFHPTKPSLKPKRASHASY